MAKEGPEQMSAIPVGTGWEPYPISNGKRLSVRDWDDVADLCEQAAGGTEEGYENHTRKARDQSAKWFRAMSMRAHDKARKLERKQS